jgi:hypothetical protein
MKYLIDKMKREIVESLIISIFTLYLFIYSALTGIFVVFSTRLYPSIYQFMVILIPYVLLPLLVFFRKNSVINRIYLYFLFIGLFTFIVLLFTYLVYPLMEVMIFLILAFYTDVIDNLYFKENRPLFYRGATFVLILFIMLLISRFLVIGVPVEPTKIVVDSIYADFSPSQVPYFFYYGIIMRVNYLYFTVGIQSIILYIILATLLTENYFLIFSIVKINPVAQGGKSRGKQISTMATPAISGGISALSCQCEGLTAILPTVAAVAATAISTTLLSESILLLLFSNFMLTVFFNRRSRIKLVSSIKNLRNSNYFPLLAIFFVMLIPVMEVIGIFYHLELTSMIFFYGVNILMFISGIFLMFSITKLGFKPFIKTIKVKTILAVTASVLMFIWFIPSIAYFAYINYYYYFLMNITGIIAGLITYLVYFNLAKYKAAYVEFTSMMFSMTALVLFYITIISVTDLFPFYGIKQQLYFSAILWGVSLPFMWLSTIDTMYRYSVTESPILLRPNNNKRISTTNK